MNDLPTTTLFMLISVDGKISTGSTDERDFDKDLPNVKGAAEGLQQYYELEKQTDRVTIQSGGEMNTNLMRSGLINFVSLVVAPVMVGGCDTASLLGGASLETDNDLSLLRSLELIGADKLADSYLHLRYKTIVSSP